jgi:hypothetical protein
VNAACLVEIAYRAATGLARSLELVDAVSRELCSMEEAAARPWGWINNGVGSDCP